MNIIQDSLMVITCFFLFLASLTGFSGASSIRRFEKRHWVILRLTFLLIYILLGMILVAVLQDVLRVSNPNLFLKVEVIVLLMLALWVSYGMGKIKATLIHGKKFSIVFTYFGVAFILMLMLLCYLKFGEYAGLVF